MGMAAPIRVLPDPTTDSWPTLWESFVRALRAEDASPRTIEVYGDAGAMFYGFLQERHYPTDPAQIEKQHCENFLIWLREERGAKPATVRARFSAIRRFFNWLVAEDELERSPWERMRGPRVE